MATRELKRERTTIGHHIKNTPLQNGVIFKEIYFKFHCFRFVGVHLLYRMIFEQAGIYSTCRNPFCEIDLLNFVFFSFPNDSKLNANGKSMHTFAHIISPSMKFWLENEFEEVVLRLHTFDSDKQTNKCWATRFPYYLFFRCKWVNVYRENDSRHAML